MAIDPLSDPGRPGDVDGAAWQRDYDRIAAAIDWLDEHRQAQPRLEDLAGALHLSPAHLQRTFSRFAGTSPSRFLRWLTAGAARRLLRERATVLGTTTDLGLSSSGRLHDLLVTLDAVTPGEVGRGGRGLTVWTAVHPTPLGLMAVAVTDRGVLQLSFPPLDTAVDAPIGQRIDAATMAADVELSAVVPHARLVRDPGATRFVVDHLVAAMNGATVGRPLVACVAGTNLQLKIWEALLRLEPGAVVSYGEVATAVGRPDAVRAVASAVGRNPVAALIPCHRVLRASGELGGYRWGTTRKRMLLAREAARADAEALPS